MAESNHDTSTDSRKVALRILLAVLKDGQSLSGLGHLADKLDPRDAAFAKLLAYGVLRYYFQLGAILKRLMDKPLKTKDHDIELTMMLAMYQVLHTRVPDYAVVDVAVKQVRQSKKKWASKLVNGVLRNFLRRQDELIPQLQSPADVYSHPQWIVDQLRQDWPEDWQSILEGNNQPPPMTLRVNQQKQKVDIFRALLKSSLDCESHALSGMPSALILGEPKDVRQLPGFAEGEFSVQDAGAQMAAPLLQPQAGDRILDACAAPGGKTAHLFEVQPDIKVTALDISEERLARVEENCQRLGFNAELIAADAAQPDEWWSGEPYDRILLDVPCSASGVIRRHPDIKHLRREEDISALVDLQRQILNRSWPLLKPGGRLLYVTCSLFKAENEQQIEWFLQQCDDAQIVELPSWLTQYQPQENLRQQAQGLQLLPLAPENDGFYYALLEKK